MHTALAAMCLGACMGPTRDTGLTDPALSWRLPLVRRALGRDVDATTLRYDVRSHDGRWTYDTLVDGARYAERRERADGASTYAFGVDERGGWLRVGGRGPVLEADDTWIREAHTRRAVLGLGFARPRRFETAVFVGVFGAHWELAYRPRRGRTVTVEIDRATQLPRSFDAHDDFGRISACEGLQWRRERRRTLLVRASCWAIAGRRNRRIDTQLRLVAASPLRDRPSPAWARADDRVPLRPLRRPESFAFSDPLRPLVPVDDGDETNLSMLVLDSGASHTTLSKSLARKLGVVPTGEVPLYSEPPWLAANDLWIGIVPRMRIGNVELHGVRVWVADDERGIQGSGLLGLDFFRRYVIELDGSARRMTLLPRSTFRPAAGHALMRTFGLGRSLLVRGEVIGVQSGELLLDTGAPLGVVVHSPMMAAVHPRRRGSDIQLGVGRDVGRSPDYVAEIAGLRLGPFPLPAMPAIGRDRERERLGGAVALVGMGVMRHFRLAFDASSQWLYAWPGESYGALVRAGVELEDNLEPNRGARVSRVVCLGEGGCAFGGLEPDDVVVRIERERVRDARHAGALIRDTDRATLGMTVERGGRTRVLEVALADMPSLRREPRARGARQAGAAAE